MCLRKKYEKNKFFASLKSLKKGVEYGSGSISQGYGSADPDLHQNVTDPQHLKYQLIFNILQDYLHGSGADTRHIDPPR
jgi:hypothetical protein